MTTIFWNIDADGDWSNTADWSPQRLPNDADDVTINTADLHSVTHGKGTDFVRTLAVGNDDFTVSGGTLTVNFSSSFANLLTVSGGTLKLSGAAVISSLAQSGGTVSGAGPATVTGPASFTGTSLQTGAAATLLEGASTIAGGAKLYLDGGRVLENQATITLAGGIEMGANPFGTALGGATIQNDAGGLIDIQAPISIDNVGGTVAFHNAGTLEQTGTVGMSKIYAPVDNSGIILVKSGALSFAGGLTNLAGTTLTGGSYEADAGATLELPPNSTIATDNATIILSGAGSGIQGLNDLGMEVTLESSLTTIGAGGTLKILGGRAWTSPQTISNSGTINLGAGTFMTVPLTITPTGVVKLNGGTLSLTGSSTVAGVISGRGALDFSGGADKCVNGAKIQVDTWSVSGGAVVTISENLTSASVFSQSAGTILSVDSGDKLSLTGPGTLAGTINGAGTVKLSNATVTGVTIGGSATLSDVGVVDQTGDLMIGDASSINPTLSIAAGATWRIDNNHGVKQPGPGGSPIIRNSGLFIKSGGTGVSIIAVKTLDAGTIEAAVGTLDFTKKLTGGGTMMVDGGAILEVGSSAASTLGMSFSGGGGTLGLGQAAKFGATISGFVAGDIIDLVSQKCDLATLGPRDTLVLSEAGSAFATLQLAGDYTGATFNVASDGNGGTNVTLTGPGGAAPAAGHRLVAAMAGLGPRGGGLDAPAAEPWRRSNPALATPRMHLA